MENVLRHLPSVDSLLANQKIRDLEKDFPRDLILNLLRETLDGYRSSISQGREPPSRDEIIRNISDQIRVLSRPGLRPLINATGVILHTNLGRAPLSEETIAAMASVSREYNNLEFDLESGERGFRDSHLEPLLCRLSGSESAIAVNNNASAVLLGLTVLARRKEVIISRGQSVEIGGGFRIPEVMRQSGAKLIEVGTTNCTRIRDYEEAITPRTFALLRVHPSNFKVMGFTQTTTLEEMVTLGKKAGGSELVKTVI